MNTHAARPDPVSHERAQQLLPWLLDCAMDAAEFAAVAAHVEACATCQADLAWQSRLRAAVPADDGAFDPGRAFARLLPRLAPQAPRASVLNRWRRGLAANTAWLRWTAAAQFAAIVVLAAMLADRGAGKIGRAHV